MIKIKQLSILLLSMIMLGVCSCKKETVDVTDLLKTVPSSAAGVVVINVAGLAEDSGCQIKDHVIIPSEEVKAFLSKSGESVEEDLGVLFDGSTGIEPTAAVLFYDSNRAFLTVALYDEEKFCKFVEEKSEGTFSEVTSGVKVCGNVAVKGVQAWLCLTSGKSIDADAIASYASLASSQSFLVTPMGEKLLTEENDVRGWGVINTFLDNMLGSRNKNVATLGIGFLFQEAESVEFKMDFKKGEVEAEMMVLNDEGKPAKYLLPADKVDTKALANLGTTCDAMMAFTVTPKLIKKFDQVGSALGGALFGDLGEMFKNIDGTVGIIGGGSGMGETLKGFITTKGEVSKTMKDMISQNVGSVSQDGKYLMFSKGDVKGDLSVAECADELKGCCMGIIYGSGSDALGDMPTSVKGFKSFMMKLEPEDGGLEWKFEAKTGDPKQNALLVIMQQ